MVEKTPPFTVLVDSREQTPWPMEGIAQVRRKLATGDYSVEVAGIDWSNRIALERKSKNDQWQCVAGERARFIRCLERLAKLEFAAVIIECSLVDFALQPAQVQRVTPATAVGSCLSWMVQYGVPFIWAGPRDHAERVALRLLASFVKHKGGVQ